LIVVDTNLVAYLWIPGDGTAVAEALLARDSDWNAPLLWRSELRNVLALYLRKKLLDLPTAIEIMTRAEEQMAGHEFSVPSVAVLHAAAASRWTAYDCEFVVLARELGTKLVTTDRRLVRAFPDEARLASELMNP
jgi:predicted nucleic acid-binding protein